MTEYTPAAGLPSKGQHVASGACSWESCLTLVHRAEAMLMQRLLCFSKNSEIQAFIQCMLTSAGFACNAGSLAASAYAEPDLVDTVRPMGGAQKAGMPTGSHSAAVMGASSATGEDWIGSMRAEEGMSDASGLSAGGNSSRPGILSGWGSREAAAKSQQSLDRRLDREFGRVTTTANRMEVPSSEGAEQARHGARDGLHELVPGDADTVVAPKAVIEEVTEGRERHAASVGAPAALEHRNKHHRSKWQWGR